MPHWIEIQDADDPRLEVYRNQRDAWLRLQRGETPADRAAGLFMAEGELVVRALLASGLVVCSVLISANRARAMEDVLGELDEQTPVYLGSADLLESIVGFDMHRGVLAAGLRPRAPALADLLRDCTTLLIAEDIANHDNMGGLFRSVAAIGGLGQSGVVLSPRCCDPLYRKAIRVSIGCAMRVPWLVADEWPGVLTEVRGAGFEVIALTPGEQAEWIDGVPPYRKRALLVGAEGPGLTPDAVAAADRRVRIPIDARVDSLNVVVAASIALHRLSGTPAGVGQ